MSSPNNTSQEVLIVRIPFQFLRSTINQLILFIIVQVGGGPSGLIFALTLLKNGISVRIIEKNSTPRIGQRGAGIMVRDSRCGFSYYNSHSWLATISRTLHQPWDHRESYEKRNSPPTSADI